MRRPVKPFVTEYKGLNRRPPQQMPVANRRSSEDAMASPSANDVFSRNGSDHTALAHPHVNHAHHSEDAYEAAMRAADALFAPAPAPIVDATQKMRAPKARDIEAGHDAVFGAPAGPDDTGDASPGRGRILRVLDEAIVPDVSEIEADDAPKRRGRKPGSKNKPKEGLPSPQKRPALEPNHFIFTHEERPQAVAASTTRAALAEPATRRRTPRVVPTQTIAPPPSVQAQTVFQAQTVLQSMAASPNPQQDQRVERPAASNDDGARSEPFSWVRVKLAPGERWKRRLPKVCW